MEKHIKGYSFLRGFLGFGFKLVYQIKITGKENIPVSGPVVVCGNHNHVHDQFPVILSTKRMIHYMAKKEYFDGKMAWFFRMAGCIPVDRSIKDESAKEEAISILEENEVFGIFPEGTRNELSCKEELIDKDFHIKSKSDDLYSMVRLEDINKYNKLSGLKRKKIVAQDGPSDYIRKVINSLSEEEFNLFIEYHLKTCERKELLGASSHILDIVEKKKVKDA